MIDFDPFNPNNVQILQKQVSIFLQIWCPDTVHNFNLYKRAFIHKSYVKRPHLKNVAMVLPLLINLMIVCLLKQNQMVEFLGDGVLECITKYYLYRRFPKRYFMTEKKSHLLKMSLLEKWRMKWGLTNGILCLKTQKKRKQNNLKLGCLFEAFLDLFNFNKIKINDEGDWFKNVFVTDMVFRLHKHLLKIFRKSCKLD